MNRKIELALTSPVAAMDAFLEPYRTWIEAVTGCPKQETLTLEFRFPFGHLVAEELLSSVDLARQCLGGAKLLRPLVRRWATPPNCSPQLELHASRDRRTKITDRKRAWDPHWKDTPIAVWLEGTDHAVVSADIPYVSYIEKGSLNWRQWIIVNRRDAAICLNQLRRIEPPHVITVIGGRDIPLPEGGYNWESVLLDPALAEPVRDDFEAFWQSETWFLEQALPYRRGYLLYGPPGNGKTSVARIMACHPLVAAFSIDLSAEGLPNEALSDLFQAAEDKAPALIILEDLDRVFGEGETFAKRSSITLPYLLNCLDGLSMQNGIVVVATANDPATLDPAILKRPGRFDRLAAFRSPSVELRSAYLRRLTHGALGEEGIGTAARAADRLSFAQLREAYILAGQQSFRRGVAVRSDQIVAAIGTVRRELTSAASHSDGRSVGFGATAPGADQNSLVCRHS